MTGLTTMDKGKDKEKSTAFVSGVKNKMKSLFSRSSSKDHDKQDSSGYMPSDGDSTIGLTLPAVKTASAINDRDDAPGREAAPRRKERLQRSNSATAEWERVEGNIRRVQRQVYRAVEEAAREVAVEGGGDAAAAALRERLARRTSQQSSGSTSRRNSGAGQPASPLSGRAPEGSPAGDGSGNRLSRTKSLDMGQKLDGGGLEKSFTADSDTLVALVQDIEEMNGGRSPMAGAGGNSPFRDGAPGSPSSRGGSPGGGSSPFRERSLRTQFTLQEKLGTGGFSTVVTAVERATGIPYAAKLIKLSGCTDKQLREVISEAGLAMGLEHPCIVNHEDVFVEKSTKECVFLMERMAAGSLQDHLMSHPRILSAPEASLVAQSLMAALAHLHSRGVAHCDIKPDNILLASAKDFSVSKLSDFGLAVHLSPEETAILNRVRGTEGFIAPELYKSRPAAQPRAETPMGTAGRRLSAATVLDAGREGDLTPKAGGGGAGNSPFAPNPNPNRERKRELEVIYTPMVDVWSAGVTLYSTLGGNWQKPIKQAGVWERDGWKDRRTDVFLFENDSMWRRVWCKDYGPGDGGIRVKNRLVAEHRACVDLVRAMLHPNPHERPTAEECLAHPWIDRSF